MKRLPFAWLYPIISVILIGFFFGYSILKYKVSPISFLTNTPSIALIVGAYLFCGINQNIFYFNDNTFYIRNPMLPFLNKKINLHEIHRIIYMNVTGNTLTPYLLIMKKNGKKISRFYQGSAPKVRKFLETLSQEAEVECEEFK